VAGSFWLRIEFVGRGGPADRRRSACRYLRAWAIDITGAPPLRHAEAIEVRRRAAAGTHHFSVEIDDTRPPRGAMIELRRA
jgi:hypothetical protein